MIMRVRLNVLKNKKPEQYKLANQYYTFLNTELLYQNKRDI